ncbi:MAG TPA: response regulator transcription factor [Verrucomicrobiae bacterium]|jgi:two-component system copper resistance phosphate regulon response regulator CusR|nr:response regulator transcription factor [Verrucomicrobiae bacterium]
MRILVVDDERKVADFVARGLREQRFVVDVANDGLAGWEMASASEYDLIVLDLMLPNLSGLELLKRIRRTGSHVPILMLTARAGKDTKTQNLEAGADDCLSKPFAFDELLVRVNALLRRGSTQRGSLLRIDDLEIDCQKQQAKRAGKQIDLTPREYSLLEFLVANAGSVVSRTMITEHVWDESFQGLTNIVDVYVRHLRNKVDDSSSKKLIHTVRGVGYSISNDTEA